MKLTLKDHEIIEAIRAGDWSVLEHVYSSSFESIKYLVMRNGGTAQDADDIFQDAMVVLYEKLRMEEFELTCSFKTFLYSVARNLWLKQLNKRKIHKAGIDDMEDYLNVDAFFDPLDEEMNESDEKISSVKNHLSRLGEKCRKILEYFFFDRLSMEEIAQKLGYTNADNAKNQKYQCIKQLRKKVFDNK